MSLIVEDKKVLEVKNLAAYYQEGRVRRQILDNVSFTLHEGETVGLLGPSGSGKTTLCKAILGLLKDYDGQVLHHTPLPQMVFQDPYSSLNPQKTIGWQLEEPLKMLKVAKAKRYQQVKAVLEQVQLPADFYERYPHQLSGGQRQRVSIAVALITGTKFILADEPLSALDVTVQAQIIELLQHLQKTKRLCMLLVSHDIDVIQILCERVLVIDGTQVVEKHRNTPKK